MESDPLPPFHLVAGHPALDFVNTLDNVYSEGSPSELLGSYPDLLRFCLQAQLLSVPQRNRLISVTTPEQRDSALAAARGFRDCCSRLFTDLSLNATLRPEDVSAFNSFLPGALERRQILASDAGMAWGWEGLTADAHGPLWPIILSAAELLVSADRERVKACQDRTCRWLFLDSSKNGSRRWCDMKLCGNRSKARLHYQKLRSGEVGD